MKINAAQRLNAAIQVTANPKQDATKALNLLLTDAAKIGSFKDAPNGVATRVLGEPETPLLVFTESSVAALLTLLRRNSDSSLSIGTVGGKLLVTYEVTPE